MYEKGRSRRRIRKADHEGGMYQEDEGRRNPLSWGRGQGEGPFLWHAEEADRRINTRSGKTYGSQAFKMLQVAFYHTLGNLPEQEPTHEFF
jgi:hypothetical protein